MDKPTGREIRTPAQIIELARAGQPTTGFRESLVTIDAWPGEDVEVRSDSDGMHFHGYAAVFNSWSEDLGGFRERIRPGAFAKSLTEKRAVKMFWNHNTDIALGSTRSNVTLAEDDRGLVTDAQLLDTTSGRDMATLVHNKVVDSMSFGFQTVKDAWDFSNDQRAERELIEVRLFEVSPVTGWPAYPKTSASVRELAEIIEADADELAQAFLALRNLEIEPTDEQADLLFRLVNARHPNRFVATSVADWRTRLAKRGLLD